MSLDPSRRSFLAAAGGAAVAYGTGINTACAESSGPLFTASELLGRPTNNSVTVNMRTAVALEIYFEYGTASGQYTTATAVVPYAALATVEVKFEGLMPDTRYYYRVRHREPGQPAFGSGAERSFHTRRSPGSSFVATVTADPHPNDGSDQDMYARTLGNAALSRPDFHFDLGDTFMGDKLSAPVTQESVEAATLNHRQWHGILGHSAALFLGLGNHEGEAGWVHNNTASNLAAWALLARKKHYLNPVPDGFYSGNSEVDSLLGHKENYYAFEWGDALFVVLDPYWGTLRKPSSTLDEWDWSLGLAQHLWLRHTLQQSRAKYRIVFTHHLLGGNPNIALDKDKLIGRGGIEAAPYGEWGGNNLLGATKDTWGWDENRPASAGWTKPIHHLLVDHNVRCVIHGHDHVWVRQVLDGIVYLAMPQPANPNVTGTNSAVAGGYLSGSVLPNSGHVRLGFLPSELSVEYVRTYNPAQVTASRVNGMVSASFRIPPVAQPNDLRIERLADRVVLTWSAETGLACTVQWSHDLAEWHDVPVGSARSWTDTSVAEPRKFYRVVA